jgi:uncharacterized protein (DUF2237 family)
MRDDLNVYGKQLAPCSGRGMANTGYTREGRCFTRPDDRGKHHICIDLENEKGFCHSTGQGTWCNNMHPCDGDPGKKCGIKNWCVCEWAFADYVDKNVKRLEDCPQMKCDAINEKVIEHYMNNFGEPGVEKALNCIVKRCELSRPRRKLIA